MGISKNVGKEMTLHKPKYGNKVLTLNLLTPPSVNQCYGTNWQTKRRFKTKVYTNWIKQAGWTCIKLGSAHKVPGKITVSYAVARPKTKHRRDVANYEKPLSDFIVSHGFIEDDSLIQEAKIFWSDDVKEGVQVRIEAAGIV